MQCHKGLGMFAELYLGQRLEIEGHGVGVFKVNGGFDIGEIDFPTHTLVSRNGGVFLDEGDIIVHTPELCELGISRAEDKEIPQEEDKNIIFWRTLAEKRTKQVLELQEILRHQ